MTLDEMWARLEAHQPYADKRGYGPAWKQMCQDRTRKTADAVADLLCWRDPEFRKHAEHGRWEAAHAGWAAFSAGYALSKMENVSMFLNKSEVQ
jgi:hypothetical protein